MGKICKTCGIEKEDREFRPKQKKLLKSGWKTYINCNCISCDNKIKLKSHNDNPTSWIRTRHSISKEAAQHWYLKSLDVCEICGKKWIEGEPKLCIDHDHNTGKIRGILCKHCNHVLGHSYDSIQILERSIQYLRERG